MKVKIIYTENFTDAELKDRFETVKEITKNNAPKEMFIFARNKNLEENSMIVEIVADNAFVKEIFLNLYKKKKWFTMDEKKFIWIKWLSGNKYKGRMESKEFNLSII
jgi:ABC-type enterochelin transport system substrate-binding protein